MPYRVVQWTTGNVGVQSVTAILNRPDLELVGCYAWSEDKIGKDVGEMCGLEPVGIAATNDVDALLALQPDCVVYNPMWLDVDEMVRILESGTNIVSTAAFVTGPVRIDASNTEEAMSASFERVYAAEYVRPRDTR